MNLFVNFQVSLLFLQSKSDFPRATSCAKAVGSMSGRPSTKVVGASPCGLMGGSAESSLARIDAFAEVTSCLTSFDNDTSLIFLAAADCF